MSSSDSLAGPLEMEKPLASPAKVSSTPPRDGPELGSDSFPQDNPGMAPGGDAFGVPFPPHASSGHFMPTPYGYPSYGPPPQAYPGAAFPPGYGPPHPYGGYPGYGGYPTQQAREKPDKPPASENKPSRRKSPKRRGGAAADRPDAMSPVRQREDDQKDAKPLADVRPAPAMAPMQHDADMRMRASEEVSPDAVRPMRSSFHFFVDDVQERLRLEAENEVGRTALEFGMDAFLVNSNLNARMIQQWEKSSSSVRASYMDKEEQDRVRFMADDEIASRHCATLTARARSPRLGSKKDSTSDEEDAVAKKKMKMTEDDSSQLDKKDDGEQEGEASEDVEALAMGEEASGEGEASEEGEASS